MIGEGGVMANVRDQQLVSASKARQRIQSSSAHPMRAFVSFNVFSFNVLRNEFLNR